MLVEEDQYDRAERLQRERMAETSNAGPIFMIGLMTASRTIRKFILVVSLCLIAGGIVALAEIPYHPGFPRELIFFPLLVVALGIILLGLWCLSKLTIWIGGIVARDVKEDWTPRS
jgi:hypothetical protein